MPGKVGKPSLNALFRLLVSGMIPTYLPFVGTKDAGNKRGQGRKSKTKEQWKRKREFLSM